MSKSITATNASNVAWDDAARWAAAFIASFRSSDTRKAYQRDLSCWFTFCAAHRLHPYDGVRRMHVEVYLRQLERQTPPLADVALRRRVSTLSS
jgi:site-specific recombinase XerD